VIGCGRKTYFYNRPGALKERDARDKMEDFARSAGYAGAADMIQKDEAVLDKTIVSKPPTTQARMLAKSHGWPDFDTMCRQKEPELSLASDGA